MNTGATTKVKRKSSRLQPSTCKFSPTFLEILRPFTDPSRYNLKPENIWVWEAGFILTAAILLAYLRQYTAFITKHFRLVMIENAAWASSSFIIIMGVSFWRKRVCTKPIDMTTSFWIALAVATFAFIFGIILEICGVNTLIYTEEYFESPCSLNENYCAGKKSKELLFEFASIWVVLFAFVITTYFVFMKEGSFDNFREHYFDRQNYNPVIRLFGGLFSIIFTVFYYVGALAMSIVALVGYLLCVLAPCFGKRDITSDMKSILDFFFKKKAFGIEFGSVIFLWMLELVVGGIIFAAPIYLVIRDRMDVQHLPPKKEEHLVKKFTTSEGLLLFGKYILVIGLKMMLESNLSQSQIQTSGIVAQQIKL